MTSGAVLGRVVAVGAASELVEGFERLDKLVVHRAGGLHGHEVHEAALAEGVAVVALLRLDTPYALLSIERRLIGCAARLEAVDLGAEVLERVAVCV